MKEFLLGGLAAILLLGGALLVGKVVEGQPEEGLLNVSYDPTREMWKELNELFITRHRQETGRSLTIRQSHGGSSSQARAVIDGLEADVVTLAMWSDTDAIRRKGLIADGWESRLPNRSLPYFSTIVFVVRKGNPRGIKDWPDLVRGNVQVITPNPKTSGNGQLSFLAGWASVYRSGADEERAREYVTELYRRVPVLDSGARGSTVTFAQRKLGDVHLTWENEAHLEVREAQGELEIVYPPRSILAEPFVAVVDRYAKRRNTQALAEKYLRFCSEEIEAQEVLARHFYRPSNKDVLARHAKSFPEMDLVPITRLVPGGWEQAREKFFGEGGVFDQVQEAIRKR